MMINDGCNSDEGICSYTHGEDYKGNWKSSKLEIWRHGGKAGISKSG